MFIIALTCSLLLFRSNSKNYFCFVMNFAAGRNFFSKSRKTNRHRQNNNSDCSSLSTNHRVIEVAAISPNVDFDSDEYHTANEYDPYTIASQPETSRRRIWREKKRQLRLEPESEFEGELQICCKSFLLFLSLYVL